MIGTLSRLGDRLFPDRQVLIRSNGRVTYLNFSGSFQMTAAAAVLMTILAVGVTSVASVRLAGSAIDMDADVPEADLGRAVQILKTQLAEAQSALKRADGKVKTLADANKDQATTPGTDAQQAAAQMDAAKLAERVAQLQNDIRTIGAQNARNLSLYERASEQLAQAAAERARLTAEKGKLQKSIGELAQAKDASEKAIFADRERLKLRIAELEKKLAAKPMQKAEAAGVADPAVGEDEEEATGPVVASDNGFSIAKLLVQLGARQGSVGGPYIAAGSNKAAQAPDEQVAKLMKTLPLSAPLDKFNFESPFGVRHDPFNGRSAMHTGVDLSAAYKTPVVSTAAGIVVFAGYSGGYGKMVEIDHGNGIHTKYGHLNRILVNVGQRLSKHAQVGLLGSSGRSTGPHVHYEVVVNGTPQDPQKFLEAGKSGVIKTAN